MKLAFCLFNYFPYGGLQRDFLRIARECRQRGHEIHVYTMYWEGESEPEFQLHLIEPSGWTNHARCHAFVKKLKLYIEAEKYDRVIGFNKMPFLNMYYAADVCYRALSHKQRGFLYRLLPRYRQLVAFEKAVFERGCETAIMLISSLQQKEYAHCYQTETERFHLLPPGIAKDRIAPPNAHEIREIVRKTYQIQKDHFLLLTVGSGFKTKGLDRAMVGLSSLPALLRERCHLFVIGQDNPGPFEKLARKLQINDRIQFLGGRHDVPNFLLAADLLLHPAYRENTGTVLLEAIVSGLPVLAVDVCGYASYVTEADAGMVLQSPFKQSEFNSALQKMILSPDRQLWRGNAISFGKIADIYNLPEKAADFIERKNVYSFDEIMALRGECFRYQNGRLTQRINLDGKHYFIKQHSGVGWKEIFKNILQLRWPVLSAQNEWLAIKKLQSLGVATPALVGYDKRGTNPAKIQSYILMEELAPVVSLEDLCKTWQKKPPAFAFKRQLIDEIARIASVMHQNSINHRDFYICHFLMDKNEKNLKLYLIDLHRAQIRRLTPERWIIKDLAGLYFSSKDIGLTSRDLYRFMKSYRNKPLREIVKTENKFWKKVKTRGEKLYGNTDMERSSCSQVWV